jgi:DNA-binding NtrC family response regulator
MAVTLPSVLLIEDDPATAELYAMKLRMDGFTVHQASDATTAEVIFRRARPGVVCLDNRLPDATGAQLAGQLIGAGAQVILLTNDQAVFEEPPPQVVRALLKSRTTPAALSAAIAEVLRESGLPGPNRHRTP